MEQIFNTIKSIGIVPVIAIDDAAKAVPLAKALVAGGLPIAEVTFRTAAAEDAIKAIAKNVPEMLLGAGTVLTCEQADKAIAAGVKFIVSPGFHPEVVRHVLSTGVSMIPGTETPGEMEQAMSMGLNVVKFFPAEQNGGIDKLKAIAGPYKNLQWIPTGGIHADNLLKYLSFDQIAACGGTWMVKKELIDEENWQEITRLTKEAVNHMLGYTVGHIGINCENSEEAMQTAKVLCALFGLDYKPGNKSDYVGDAVELMKEPYLGSKGHIGFATNFIERAMYQLARHGVTFNDSTIRYDAKGKLRAIYLNGEYSGFAIHLMQKP